MKKYYVAMLAAVLTLSVVGCGADKENQGSSDAVNSSVAASGETEESGEAVASSTPASSEEADKSSAEAQPAVMSYAEYIAAELDTEVVVETYVQAKQSWWEDKATVYTQDEDGAYFLYNMACSEEDYAKLTTGTKIRVTGYKSEWSGEVEIVDATFEIIDGNYVAAPVDVTELLGTDELIKHQNEFVSFNGMVVADKGDGAAYLYKWDGSGKEGDDLYFDVTDANGNTYTFTVESYLCGVDTEVYKAVQNLKVGDKIDMEGFLYWYEGVNPHITSVKVVTE
ncbi:MAG: hypothetical protein ACI4HQ_02640 [Acetatifactor sp.]